MNQAEKQAIQMALEALEYVLGTDHKYFDVDKGQLLSHRAVEHLRTALAQPEQVGFNGLTESETEQTMSVKGLSTEQEPVYAFRRKGLDDFCTCDKRRYDELAGKPNLFEVAVFYTAPPKREWVGLTDEEIWSDGDSFVLSEKGVRDFARAIETKLKEKNT